MKWQATSFPRRRRVLMLVTLLIGVTTLLVVRSLRWNDPQLCGEWVIIEGAHRPSEMPVDLIFSDRPGVWNFRPDGTGLGDNHRYGGSYSWWTRNGRIYIDYNSTRRQSPVLRFLPRMAQRWFANWHYQPQLSEFDYVVIDENNIRLKVVVDGLDAAVVMYLTRSRQPLLP